MRKSAVMVGLLLLLTGCGPASQDATAPARDEIKLVAHTKEEAMDQCMTLENELVGDCLAAVVNTSW